MPTKIPIGRLTESVTFRSAMPPAIAVTALTSIGPKASAVTGQPHGLRSGDYASVRGAMPLAYNTASAQVTVTAANQCSSRPQRRRVGPAAGVRPGHGDIYV